MQISATPILVSVSTTNVRSSSAAVTPKNVLPLGGVTVATFAPLTVLPISSSTGGGASGQLGFP